MAYTWQKKCSKLSKRFPVAHSWALQEEAKASRRRLADKGEIHSP